jgi:polyhydroxybutyrate depolymerase
MMVPRCCFFLALAVGANAQAGLGPASALPPGLSSFAFAAGARRANVYVPRSLNASAPAPLVLFVHGWTASCEALGAGCADKLCLFREHAESRGFIFAALCSPTGSFNAGACCPPANSETEPTDDVAAARALVRALSKRALVDPKRVYATGFSNGGMLAQRLACEAPDVFRAVASVAGTVALRGGSAGMSGLDACRAALRAAKRKSGRAGVVLTPSVLDIHGEDDALVPSSGSPFLGFPAVPSVFAMWSELVGGCRPPLMVRGAAGGTRTTWLNCTAGVQLQSVTLAGVAHEWPYTPAFDATTAVLDFFDAAAGTSYGVATPADGYPSPKVPPPSAKPSKTPRPARRERGATPTATARARERPSRRGGRAEGPVRIEPLGEAVALSGPVAAELGAKDAETVTPALSPSAADSSPPAAMSPARLESGDPEIERAPPPLERDPGPLLADLSALMEALQH